MDLKQPFLFRIRTYFLRGHTQWFAVVLSMWNFITIQYTLFVSGLGLETWFGNIFIFGAIFLLCYTPIVVLLGYWDYKKGAFRTDAVISYKNNPYAMEILAGIQRIEKKIAEE